MYAAAAKSLQSCPTLCNTTDGSPPGPPVPGILQARTLEWVAISFSTEVVQLPAFAKVTEATPEDDVAATFTAHRLVWGRLFS